MSKIIVTHKNPDIDALTSIWLIERFLPGFSDAEVKFVPAGGTLEGINPDADPDILHVDTGMGVLDHHQRKAFSSASRLVLAKIVKERPLKKDDKKALKRLVEQVTEMDNGRDASWPEPESDRYEFMFNNLVINNSEAQDFWQVGLRCLDKVFQIMKSKVKAEELIDKEGVIFETRWGKAVAALTGNDQVIQVGLRQGYVMVAKQNPKTNHLRIYSRFDRGVDLRKAFKEFKKRDPEATWYLHPSRCLLLNGSRANPNMKTTSLSFEEIIEILKKA
ncbi:MAG: DHH family phosphoesterase [bacterium]|nr:DHH family phosphoesterase [bacterium]